MFSNWIKKKLRLSNAIDVDLIFRKLNHINNQNNGRQKPKKKKKIKDPFLKKSRTSQIKKVLLHIYLFNA